MATAKKAAAKVPARKTVPAKKRPVVAPEPEPEEVEEVEAEETEEVTEESDAEQNDDAGEEEGEEEGESTGKSRMSDKSQLAFALNNLLAFTKAYLAGEVELAEGTEVDDIPEITFASSSLERAGFTPSASTAQEVARIQDEIQSLDFSDPNASRRMKELAKELNKANSVRGLRS